jgi:hypothetical protein
MDFGAIDGLDPGSMISFGKNKSWERSTDRAAAAVGIRI